MSEKVEDVWSLLFEDDPEQAEDLRKRSALLARVMRVSKELGLTHQEMSITQSRFELMRAGKLDKFSTHELVALNHWVTNKYKERIENSNVDQ